MIKIELDYKKKIGGELIMILFNRQIKEIEIQTKPDPLRAWFPF